MGLERIARPEAREASEGLAQIPATSILATSIPATCYQHTCYLHTLTFITFYIDEMNCGHCCGSFFFGGGCATFVISKTRGFDAEKITITTV